MTRGAEPKTGLTIVSRTGTTIGSKTDLGIRSKTGLQIRAGLATRIVLLFLAAWVITGLPGLGIRSLDLMPCQAAHAAVDSREVGAPGTGGSAAASSSEGVDYISMAFVFVLATFIGLGVVARVSRLLHTPLMSLTNAISAIAVVGSLLVTGADYPNKIRLLGAVALFASMTNIVSGFLITDRMLKMFKQTRTEGKR